MTETRFPFRILAGLTGVFVLAVGLPAAVDDAQAHLLRGILFAICCMVSGIGLSLSAFTGRWFNSPA